MVIASNEDFNKEGQCPLKIFQSLIDLLCPTSIYSRARKIPLYLQNFVEKWIRKVISLSNNKLSLLSGFKLSLILF